MSGTGRDTSDGAQRREQGVAIAFIGLAVILVDLLVVFFAPAAFRIGRQGAFVTLIIVLAVIGLALILFGQNRRRTAL
jgi:protein-S-isoprenylcysteine O-methyltransferase Ste14